MKRRTIKKKYNREVKDLKLKLKRNKDCSHGRLFLSYENYDGEFTWSDIYFIGSFKNQYRVFNTTIMSSLDQVDNLLDDKINSELDKIYPNRHKNTEFVFNNIPDNKDLKSMELIIHNDKLEEDINNKKKELEDKYLSEGIEVQSYIKVLPGYSYGIGIEIYTEEKLLNKKIITDYVKSIQKMNIFTSDKIFLSNNKISFNKKEYSEALKNSARKLNF